ncbi:MATE family efflux transporter [Flammeovirga kamogawensis]|uniref:Multidrug-efflux transporter n=1 Tax=Flammeovirga kamogawensis TaxID=373891 RepID=A0ABX8H4C5_9BACT|nr:MATE family efflux transporter [Flammeovirga kamogawensis]MBB6460198.1 MATE family multidrug resistance protein [Flammeovirga kamogawensis]QWG10010.1 MATE family efflux transporter [Flammeovirga kamogawensis]TRX65518.1 MATE family efflux transporter [Flammeovirga kamogawensis]
MKIQLKRQWESYSPLFSSILKLGWPVILAQMGQISVGIVDNMIIGQLGRTPLAAASFTNTIFNVVLLFGMGFTFILTPKIGEAIGLNSPKKAVEAFKNSFVSNVLICIALLAILVGLNIGMPYMGQPTAIISDSQNYLWLLALSLIPQIIFLTYKQFFEGIGDTKTGMKITLLGNIVNIIGDFIFVFGLFGAPKMGLLGAGVGTLLARIFMAFAAYWVFTYRKLYAKYAALLSEVKVYKSELISFFKNGIPMAFQMLMESSAFSVSTLMMGWVSEVGLAAHQVALSLSTLGYMVYQGIGSATGILVSQEFGQRNFKEVNRITNASLIIIVSMSIGAVVFFLTGRSWMPYLFTQDEEVIHFVRIFIFWLATYQTFDAIEIVYAGALRGLHDFKVPMWLIFSSYFIIAIPFSYFCAFHWGQGEAGIWMGFPLGLGIICLFFVKRFKDRLSFVEKYHIQQSKKIS